jgi:hypothetical protein
MFLSGKRDIPVKSFDKVAAFLEVDVQDLLSDEPRSDLLRHAQQTPSAVPKDGADASPAQTRVQERKVHLRMLQSIVEHAETIAETAREAKSGAFAKASRPRTGKTDRGAPRRRAR